MNRISSLRLLMWILGVLLAIPCVSLCFLGFAASFYVPALLVVKLGFSSEIAGLVTSLCFFSSIGVVTSGWVIFFVWKYFKS